MWLCLRSAVQEEQQGLGLWVRVCLLTISLAIHNNEKANVEKVHDRMNLNVRFLMQT